MNGHLNLCRVAYCAQMSGTKSAEAYFGLLVFSYLFRYKISLLQYVIAGYKPERSEKMEAQIVSIGCHYSEPRMDRFPLVSSPHCQIYRDTNTDLIWIKDLNARMNFFKKVFPENVEFLMHTISSLE